MDLPLRFVHVCNTLAGTTESIKRFKVDEGETDLPQVELSVLLVGNTFYLDEGSIRAAVALCTLVTEYAALAVESAIVENVSKTRSLKWNMRIKRGIHSQSHPSTVQTSNHGLHDDNTSTVKHTDLVEPIFCLEVESDGVDDRLEC